MCRETTKMNSASYINIHLFIQIYIYVYVIITKGKEGVNSRNERHREGLREGMWEGLDRGKVKEK